MKQRSKVRFDRRIFAERPRNQLPPHAENSFEQLRTLSQLLLLAPFVVLLLIACGHLALITVPQIAFADKPAYLTAEYGQWGFLQVRSVRKEIIAEIQRDFGESADVGETFALPIPKLGFAWLEEPSSPVVIASLPTVVPTEPTIVPSPVNNQYASILPPSSPDPTKSPDAKPTKSAPPTIVPTATDPNSPTNTPGPSPTPTPTSPGPQPTNTPLPTVTSTTVTTTAQPPSSPTATATSSPAPTATSTAPPPTATATTAPTMAPTATSTPGGSASWWNSCYSYRKQVTVMTAGAGVNEGYTGKLSFNHSSLVSAGKSRSDGADVRLVWQSESNLVQLDRMVAHNGGSWNRSNTEIYFKLAAGLPPYSSDGKYYLYFGCSSPGTPPQDANDVYWYSNQFNTDNPLSGWTQRDVEDVGVWEVRSGHLEHESVGRQTSQVPNINHKLVLTGKPVIQNLVVNFEFLMRDDDLISVGLCSNDNSPSGFYVGFSADRWFDDDGVSARTGYWKNASSSGYSNTSLSMGPVYRPTITWTSSQILNSLNGNNYQWNAGPSSANYFCFATNSMDVALDDLFIREYVNPEPVSSLGSEEVQ